MATLSAYGLDNVLIEQDDPDLWMTILLWH